MKEFTMHIGFLCFLSWIVSIQTYHIYRDVSTLWDYNRPDINSKIIERAVTNNNKGTNFNKATERFALQGPRMGVSNISCDDAINNLSIDWNYSPVNYTCYTPKYPLPVIKDMQPVEESDDIPTNYIPKHHCMPKSISYDSPIPTHGDHRPLWPVFGEYSFVPPQRWLHSIEHGAVVMLFHPCANLRLVDELRSLVKSCIRKHIITADSKIPASRPFALVSWGHRLLMNHIDHQRVISFIKKYALHGPEGKLEKEGQYKLMLISKAVPPGGSDMSDSNLCPGL